MGHNLSVYCEYEIFSSKKIQNVVASEITFWGETTVMGKGGYFFFGDYRIYHEKSLFYQICNKCDLNFYKYFDPLVYTDGGPELKELKEGWCELGRIEINLIKFIKLLKGKTLEELMWSSEICEGYSVLRFPGYFNNNLISELEQTLTWIKVFKKHGAKRIIIGYD